MMPDSIPPVKTNTNGLQWAELQKLFEATDWSVIGRERSIEETYGKILTQSYFKAWTLPYLYPLAEERYLAEELAERELLQDLCDFTIPHIPTHNKLRHFRHRYSSIFPVILRRLLTSMAIAAHHLGILLPFTEIVEDVEQLPEGVCESFRLEQKGEPYVILWISEYIEGNIRGRNNTQPQTRTLVGDLKLPVEAYVQLSGVKKRTFNVILDKPAWLQNKYGAVDHDPITTLGSAHIVRPYTACNIIVERQLEGRRQILLSKRLVGYGLGEYKLPGGKCSQQDSSIQACATRELREETGLKLLSSRPVSIHKTRYPGKPRVKSVGVYALSYEGKLRHREEHQNTPWRWYDLDNLPTPLFDPSKLAIEDYKKKKFPDLEWSDVEEKQIEEKQLSLFEGLDLSK